MSITLFCLVEGNTTANAFEVDIEKDNNLSFEDSDELLAIRKISKYFPDSLLEEHIHVLVEPPETTATSSREQELLDRIASLEKSLNKSTHAFDVVVRPKQKANKWTVNIEQATLKDLRWSSTELHERWGQILS
ncbi:unnamed protein product [Rhizophagus irregularis]|nr:unnamed protein product [Rhizophagus irregularis]